MIFRLHVSHRSKPEGLRGDHAVKSGPTSKGDPRKSVLFLVSLLHSPHHYFEKISVIPFNYNLISGIIILYLFKE